MIATLFRNIQAKEDKHTDTKTRLKNLMRVKRNRPAENETERSRP